jgi:hypothetical protein
MKNWRDGKVEKEKSKCWLSGDKTMIFTWVNSIPYSRAGRTPGVLPRKKQ